MPSTNRFGSNPGLETKARISPVDGSRATSAPRRSPNARSATCCSLMSRASRRLLPEVGGLTRQRAHGAAAGVDLDLFDAGRAVQFALVRYFDADLADVIGALVVRGVAPFLDALDVTVVDAADVADEVRRGFAVRILPEQPRLDLDAWKPVAIHGEACDFLVGKPCTQGQALEILRVLEQPLESFAVARLDVDDPCELVDHRVEILHARRGDFEGIARVALRQHHAVAIGDDAAIGCDRHDRDPIAFRQRLVVLMQDQLQVDETTEQTDERDEHQRARDHEAAAEEEQLAPGVFQLRRLQARSALTIGGEETAHGGQVATAPQSIAWAVAATAGAP